MRVAILTRFRRGPASRCLPELIEYPDVDVEMIVFCLGHYKSRWRKLRRDLKKVAKIGPLGAAVGVHMRGWSDRLEPPGDLFDLAKYYEIPLEISPRTNADETVAALKQSEAELGLSLGNAIIFPKVFRVLKHGMINVHGELLPDFQGAASVIWSIYEGRTETGFTIHQIDRHIDTGPILYQERMPIRFYPTLRETTEVTRGEITRHVPPAVAEVAGHYQSYLEKARVQRGGRSYTTPTFKQFRRMREQNARLYAESRKATR